MMNYFAFVASRSTRNMIQRKCQSQQGTFTNPRTKRKLMLRYSDGIVVRRPTNPESQRCRNLGIQTGFANRVLRFHGAIIAYLEVEGGKLSPNPRRLKKASGLDLTRNRLPSAFHVPAYDDLSDASDSDYEITDDWVEIIEWL
jgi:hypothetical protein